MSGSGALKSLDALDKKDIQDVADRVFFALTVSRAGCNWGVPEAVEQDESGRVWVQEGPGFRVWGVKFSVSPLSTGYSAHVLGSSDSPFSEHVPDAALILFAAMLGRSAARVCRRSSPLPSLRRS